MTIPGLSRITGQFTYGTRIRPVRDWLVVISVCSILFLITVAWSVVLFLRVVNGEAVGVVTQQTSTASVHSVKNLDAIFAARAAEAAKYKTQYRFVDPSH